MPSGPMTSASAPPGPAARDGRAVRIAASKRTGGGPGTDHPHRRALAASLGDTRDRAERRLRVLY